MPLIPLFDKWILEHGSATLSKEVIADLRQKIIDSDSAHAREVQELKAAQMPPSERRSLVSHRPLNDATQRFHPLRPL
jgi:hypothetical protein